MVLGMTINCLRRTTMKYSIMYYVYRVLYSVTLDRRWLLKCVDVIQRDIRDEVITFMNSKEV